MPNRIIKESICVSDSIAELSWFEEVLFYRLIVSCDDYGRFDGRIPVIKNRLFPLKDNLTAKAVSDGINKLASAGLVVLYEFEGKPYLYLPTWNDHQNVRAKKSKYPAPEDSLITYEYGCTQMNSDVPVIQSVSESESVSEYEDNANGETSVRKPVRHKYGAYQNVLLSDSDFEKLQDEFPHDFQERIERLSGYMESTGKKYKNHLATIRNWAKRDASQKPVKDVKSSNPFLDMLGGDGYE